MSSSADAHFKMGVVARAGSWASRHRRTVLIGWIVVLVASLGISRAVGSNFSTNFSLPGTDSQPATEVFLVSRIHEEWERSRPRTR